MKENISKNDCKQVYVECLDLMDKSGYDKHNDKHDIIIGADIIYDNDITDALIEFTEHILHHDLVKNKLFFFSIEKRYIFTIDDLDTIAPSYEYFMAKLDDLIKTLYWFSVDENLHVDENCNIHKNSPKDENCNSLGFK